LKYLFISLILFLTSCSLNKDSAYWNEDSFKKPIKNKKLSKTLIRTGDFKTMTFNEFSLFLQDYSNNQVYPDINK
tara:strand:+ start:33 stop:257 length:225 start_codon:yes stop_codon:yes gene_type:complete